MAGQMNIFATMEEETSDASGGESESAQRPLPSVPPWSQLTALSREKEVLGFYVTGHPLESFAPALARFSDTSVTTASEKLGREVRVGGLITSLRETRTRRGQTMAFGTLEDLEGSFDLVIFADPYAPDRMYKGYIPAVYRLSVVMGPLDMEEP